MKKIETTFLVDNVIDRDGRAKVVRGLRAVVRLGRLAERALAALEKDGHFVDRAPWLARSKYGKGHFLKYSRFPSIPSLSREDVPGYGPIEYSTGEVFLKEAGVYRYDCVRVYVVAHVPRDGDWRLERVPIGYVQLNTSSSTFYPSLPDLYDSDGYKTEQKPPRSISLLKSEHRFRVRAMAECVAENLAGGRNLSPFLAMYYAGMAEWLEKDGHASALLNELRDYASNHKTVRRVLND